MIQVKERENADRVKLEEVRSFYDTPWGWEQLFQEKMDIVIGFVGSLVAIAGGIAGYLVDKHNKDCSSC